MQVNFTKTQRDWSSKQTHIDFEPIKRWVHNCEVSHNECRPVTQREIRDLRLIDCMNRVVCTAPTGSQFVALSYVWGKLDSGATREHGSLPAELPRTIEDSIVATQRLGYRYLWIDKFCIRQDNASDKHIQIQQMDKIYSSAEVTLIATAGKDPSYGLPGVSDGSAVFNWFHRVDDDVTLSYCPPPCDFRIFCSTWSTRAWTFQEGYLSRRRLYFTESGVLMVCNHSHHSYPEEEYSEIFYLSGTIPELVPSDYTQPDGLGKAMNILQNYSRRTLGYDSDALNAITAVLNHLKNGLDSINSMWGVPFSESHEETDQARLCINWYHDLTRSRRTGFPSWSPLGWHGYVRFNGPSSQYCLTHQEAADLQSRSERMSKENDPSENSRLLRITAWTFRLPICNFSAEMSWNVKELRAHIAVPFTDDTGHIDINDNIHVLILWDTYDLSPEETTSALFMYKPPAGSSKEGLLLILRSYGEYYERIGSVSSTWVREKAKRRDHPSQSDDRTSTAEYSKYVEYVQWEDVEPCLRRLCSGKEETILLG